MRLVEEIRHELAMRVDPVYREGCRKFLKEDVEPLGVRSADLKAAEFIAYKTTPISWSRGCRLAFQTYPKRPEEIMEFLRLGSFPRLVVRYAAERMTDPTAGNWASHDHSAS